MIELYAFMSLLGLGYLLSKRSADHSEGGRDAPTGAGTPASAMPSMNTVYDSTHYHNVRQTEERFAADHFEKAKRAKRSGVIGRTYRDSLETAADPKRVRSDLAGVELDIDDFKHNNMTPFFGSRVKQNLSSTANRNVLENFTGNFEKDMWRTKHEIKPMFKMTPNEEAVYGNRVHADKHMERFAASRTRNNEKPFQPIYVAPGLNQPGYQSKGVGGFQQSDMNELVMPKTVDDLRVVGKRKDTYEGRFIPGAGMGQRGFAGKMYKNRPNIVEERMSNERVFVTASGHEGRKLRSDVREALKSQERESTSVPYFGDAGFQGSKAMPVDAQVKETDRQQLRDFGMRNVVADDEGRGVDHDYGREGIELPAQERDLTAEKTYEGNLTSLVKAIVAPLEDILRFNRKEYHVDNARPYGQVQPQAPARVTVKDPNDVARTTIKETMVEDTREGAVKGPLKLTVYDPDDVARTTIRETNKDVVNQMNIHGGSKAGKAYDPDDPARTTVRETTLSEARKGNVQTKEGEVGAYQSTEYDAKKTQKEFLSDHDYFGGAKQGYDDGYKIVESDEAVPRTQKEYLSDHDFFGIMAGTGSDKRQTSYEEYYNAEMNVLREGTLEKRAPVYEGDKATVGSEDVNMATRKLTIDEDARRKYNNANKVHTSKKDADDIINLTKNPSSYCGKDRLDVTVLSALSTNPYAIKPLSCAN